MIIKNSYDACNKLCECIGYKLIKFDAIDKVKVKLTQKKTGLIDFNKIENYSFFVKKYDLDINFGHDKNIFTVVASHFDNNGNALSWSYDSPVLGHALVMSVGRAVNRLNTIMETNNAKKN